MRTTEETARATAARPSAVTWIDDRHAMVATNTREGRVALHEIARRGGVDGLDETYLARVVDEIGDRERVVILGPNVLRLALEREYVSIYQRPERLVDVELSESLDDAGLAERLRDLEVSIGAGRQ